MEADTQGVWLVPPGAFRQERKRVFDRVVNVFLGMVAIIGLYLFPMYLVGHWYFKSVVWLGPAISAVVVLKYTWYENLPEFGVV